MPTYLFFRYCILIISTIQKISNAIRCSYREIKCKEIAMKAKEKILKLFIRICHFNFGAFEKEEFKKFLRMGSIFALIIGVYWTLRPLKDSIFMQLVDKMYLPYAKTISVLALLP